MEPTELVAGLDVEYKTKRSGMWPGFQREQLELPLTQMRKNADKSPDKDKSSVWEMLGLRCLLGIHVERSRRKLETGGWSLEEVWAGATYLHTGST